jgi:methyltransferase (TIGR00027 family)
LCFFKAADKKNESSFFYRIVMKTSQASRTAQLMAMFRALESARPAGARLFADPFAICFLKRPIRLAIRVAEKSTTFQSRFANFIDQHWPGARPSGVARTVFIDRTLRGALASGAEQVAILGAGYDARAYRIEEMKSVRVFEVDRGETQRMKRALLARAPRLSLKHVTFVEIDFLRQTLGEALRGAGFDPQRKTFFIWEGVTHYLDSSAVDSTMRFVGICAVGGWIVFTYIHRGLLDGSGRFTVSPNVSRLLDKAGEPWKLGFYPEELPDYLHDRGLRLVEDLGAVEYGARCMGASAAQMRGYEFYRVAVAMIADAGDRDCQK